MNAAARSLIAGTPHSAAALLYPNGSFVANVQTGHPVFVLKNPYSDCYHFSTMKANNTHHSFRIATSQSNYISKKTDEQFNLENFSQGGTEFGEQRIESNSVAGINSSGDFGTLDHQLSCELDPSSHSNQFIVWDYNHNIAISSKWFHTFQYNPYQDIYSEIIPYLGTEAPNM